MNPSQTSKLLAVWLFSAGLAGLPLPAAPSGATSQPQTVGANVQVNAPQLPSPLGQLGRPGLAVAASADGQLILAAWDDFQGMCGPPMGRRCEPQHPPGLTGIGYSTDGGHTWTDLGAPPPVDGFMTGGHAWIDRGGADSETFYVVSRGRKIDDGSFSGQIGFVVNIGRFENGAFVWKSAHYLKPNQGDQWRGSSVAATKDGSGRVYVSLSNLFPYCGRPSIGAGQIEVLRSSDSGATWEKPVLVGRDETFELHRKPEDPLCGSRGRFQLTPTMALGPRNEVYVVWQYGPSYRFVVDPLNQESSPSVNIRFARSLDGGETFGDPRDVAIVNSLNFNAPAGFSKDNLNDTPRIAVAQSGPHRGRIYVTYASAEREVDCGSFILGPKDYSPVSSQVYLIWSDDRGENWSHPVPLGPPVPPTHLKRFFPAVAVHPDGSVDAVYMESRETQRTPDPLDVECATQLNSGTFRQARALSLVDLWWVQSTDGGATFGPPTRVTSQTSDWCDAHYDFAGFLFANFADYLGIFPASGKTLLIWADGRNGVPDAYFSTLETP